MDTVINSYSQLSEDYRRVEQAIGYIEANFRQQPSLSQVANHLHLSEYHFQRLFTRWVGVSPKRYLQFLTKEYAKEILPGSNLLETTYNAGLSSPSRLHDLFVTWEAVTPGEYKQRGAGLTIWYAILPSPFGECLLALTTRGVCSLKFVQTGEEQSQIDALKRDWGQAQLVEDESRVAPTLEEAFAPYLGKKPDRMQMYVRGTNFQIKVWEALLSVEPGRVISYHDLAVRIGMPSAARAVGQAVANNPLAVLIPCHRVINQNGKLGGYRYGSARKRAMLAWEMCQTTRDS
jgi:AraC family transcriptional regulator of adaptative response/methylated-DNA-[protein]-cysteine methyltransferase